MGVLEWLLLPLEGWGNVIPYLFISSFIVQKVLILSMTKQLFKGIFRG